MAFLKGNCVPVSSFFFHVRFITRAQRWRRTDGTPVVSLYSRGRIMNTSRDSIGAITLYLGDCVARACFTPVSPNFRPIPQQKKIQEKKRGRRKKTEVRCSSRDDARRASGGPSAAAGLINRSRDRAWHRRRQRVVAPRGLSEGYQLLREETAKRREEKERGGGKSPTNVCVYACR